MVQVIILSSVHTKTEKEEKLRGRGQNFLAKREVDFVAVSTHVIPLKATSLILSVNPDSLVRKFMQRNDLF